MTNIMNGYLLLAFVPLGILLGYGIYKLFIQRFVRAYLDRSRLSKVIDSGMVKVNEEEETFIQEAANELDEIAEKAMTSVEEAKIIVFDFLYRAYDFLIDSIKMLGHYLMHFFVIFMRLLRDFSDWIYTKSRDRFVETAAKERKSVRRFWKHLKEYKKESDQEDE
jgi:hypothetical protein